MDLKNFGQAIDQLAEEKGVSKEKILETIEMAIAAAYKKDYGKRGQIIKTKLNPVTGELSFTQIKIVVDETMIKSEEEIKAEEEERAKRLADAAAGIPHEEKEEKRVESEDEKKGAADETGQEEEKRVRFNPEKHLMLEEAIKTKEDAKPGDELEFPLETKSEFGRIASQTAKQVIIQRIREAEREAVFEEYKNKEGELVSGIIQRIEGRNVYVDLGRGAGILPPEEQIPHERYRLGDRIKAVVTLVESNPKGPGIFLSRSHPRLIKKLFEIEVPEISAGTVEIKAVAREAGSRSKVAVESKEENIDPVGSLVGQKGVRVTTVINELGGEKIDIIEWSGDPAAFIGNSLSPARVLNVDINEKRKEARAIVSEDQLSLAIGKNGQNVRLAAKLTGWRIDIRSQKGEVAGEAGPQDEKSGEEEKPEEKEEIAQEQKDVDEKIETPEKSATGKTAEKPEEKKEEKKPKKEKKSRKKT